MAHEGKVVYKVSVLGISHSMRLRSRQSSEPFTELPVRAAGRSTKRKAPDVLGSRVDQHIRENEAQENNQMSIDSAILQNPDDFRDDLHQVMLPSIEDSRGENDVGDDDSCADDEYVGCNKRQLLNDKMGRTKTISQGTKKG